MVAFASYSHAGRVHNDNEDSIGVDAARGIWLVADGMGGHASGEVASGIVRDTIMSRTELPLVQAVAAAHEAVAAAGNTEDERYHGMGSTVVALALQGATAQIVWVGDSRAYLWRRGVVRRLSRDHSYVELLRDSNGITEEQIRVHPQRNLVTQTLGIGAAVPSSAQVELRVDDWLMLCSDGLNDELDDDEIAAHLRRSATPQNAVVELVDAALAGGGRDNISVVIVAIARGDLPSRWRTLRSRTRELRSRTRELRSRGWFPAVIGVVGALLLGSLVLFYLK